MNYKLCLITVLYLPQICTRHLSSQRSGSGRSHGIPFPWETQGSQSIHDHHQSHPEHNNGPPPRPNRADGTFEGDVVAVVDPSQVQPVTDPNASPSPGEFDQVPVRHWRRRPSFFRRRLWDPMFGPTPGFPSMTPRLGVPERNDRNQFFINQQGTRPTLQQQPLVGSLLGQNGLGSNILQALGITGANSNPKKTSLHNDASKGITDPTSKGHQTSLLSDKLKPNLSNSGNVNQLSEAVLQNIVNKVAANIADKLADKIAPVIGANAQQGSGNNHRGNQSFPPVSHTHGPNGEVIPITHDHGDHVHTPHGQVLLVNRNLHHPGIQPHRQINPFMTHNVRRIPMFG